MKMESSQCDQLLCNFNHPLTERTQKEKLREYANISTETEEKVKCSKATETALSYSYLKIRASCHIPVIPRKKLTANRFQFFGIITVE